EAEDDCNRLLVFPESERDISLRKAADPAWDGGSFVKQELPHLGCEFLALLLAGRHDAILSSVWTDGVGLRLRPSTTLNAKDFDLRGTLENLDCLLAKVFLDLVLLLLPGEQVVEQGLHLFGFLDLPVSVDDFPCRPVP